MITCASRSNRRTIVEIFNRNVIRLKNTPLTVLNVIWIKKDD